MKIGDKKVEKWRTAGLVVKDNLLTEDEIAQAHGAVAELAAAVSPGTHRVDAFPFADSSFTGIALHPEFLSLVERALNTAHAGLADSALIVTAGPFDGEDAPQSASQRLNTGDAELVVTIVPMLDLAEESGAITFRAADGEQTVTAAAGAAIVVQAGTPYRLGTVAAGSIRVLIISAYAEEKSVAAFD